MTDKRGAEIYNPYISRVIGIGGAIKSRRGLSGNSFGRLDGGGDQGGNLSSGSVFSGNSHGESVEFVCELRRGKLSCGLRALSQKDFFYEHINEGRSAQNE